MTCIKPPPEHFEGSIAEFVDAYVVPNLPSADRLMAWTETLLAYHGRPDAVLVVRGRAGARGAPRRWGSHQIVESDNSPGRWCYLRAFDGEVVPETMASILDDGALPVLYAASKAERVRWTYGQAMSTRDKNAFSGPRVKHCHIEEALDGAPPSLRVRALRNLCPTNHFLWPMPTKFRMRRLGWTEPSMRKDLGESAVVISHVQLRLAQHLGAAGLRVYRRYLDQVGGRLRGDDGLRRIAIERKPRAAPPVSPRPTTRGSSHMARPAPTLDSEELWATALRPAKPLEAAALMAEHPHAEELTLELLRDGCTASRIVAITNAMYNPCRPASLRKSGLPDTPEQAWEVLFHRRDTPHSSRPSKWRPLVAALEPIPPHVEAQIRGMSITELGSLAASIVRGPYAAMESA